MPPQACLGWLAAYLEAHPEERLDAAVEALQTCSCASLQAHPYFTKVFTGSWPLFQFDSVRHCPARVPWVAPVVATSPRAPPAAPTRLWAPPRVSSLVSALILTPGDAAHWRAPPVAALRRPTAPPRHPAARPPAQVEAPAGWMRNNLSRFITESPLTTLPRCTGEGFTAAYLHIDLSKAEKDARSAAVEAALKHGTPIPPPPLPNDDQEYKRVQKRFWARRTIEEAKSLSGCACDARARALLPLPLSCCCLPRVRSRPCCYSLITSLAGLSRFATRCSSNCRSSCNRPS